MDIRLSGQPDNWPNIRPDKYPVQPLIILDDY